MIAVLALGAAVVGLLHNGGNHGNTGGGSGSGSTRYGASFQTRAAESYATALGRVDASFGHLDLVRVFYPGAPDPWPGKAPDRNVVVSFKLKPKGVLAGRYDSSMKDWFATVPDDVDVYWAYWHEPENDIESGKFSAADYRAAFTHLDELADQAGKPRLKSTVILQSFSTRRGSGRNWHDYLPDAQHVDVLSWDVYNRTGAGRPYQSPAVLLDAPLRASQSFGKPFAVTELASVLAAGDQGAGRAAWLRRMGAYLDQHHALFACYFDFLWNGGRDDYRLKDSPSLRAWKDISAT